MSDGYAIVSQNVFAPFSPRLTFMGSKEMAFGHANRVSKDLDRDCFVVHVLESFHANRHNAKAAQMQRETEGEIKVSEPEPEPISLGIEARHGGKDPDRKNAERIAFGQNLANHLSELTGVDLEDAVGDAIAYLLHAAPTWGQSPQEALKRGVMGFNDDTKESWTPSKPAA